LLLQLHRDLLQQLVGSALPGRHAIKPLLYAKYREGIFYLVGLNFCVLLC
jgi:hypothetical protein